MSRIRRLIPSVPLAAFAVLLLAGCGGSSKPGYCSKVTDLKKSVQQVTDVSLKDGKAALISAAQKVETGASSVVSAAKSDFPAETSALKTSVGTLTSAVHQVTGSSNPAPSTVVALASDIAASVTAGKNFAAATSAKCG